MRSSATVNRQEVVSAVAKSAEVTKDQADRVLTAFAETTAAAVSKGDAVRIPGFLTVERVERSARSGRNPQTGESIQIPARYGVKRSEERRVGEERRTSVEPKEGTCKPPGNIRE